VETEPGGTWRRMRGEVKGKEAKFQECVLFIVIPQQGELSYMIVLTCSDLMKLG